MNTRLSIVLSIAVVGLLLFTACLNNEEEAPATAVAGETGAPVEEQPVTGEEGAQVVEGSADTQPADTQPADTEAADTTAADTSGTAQPVAVQPTAAMLENLPPVAYVDPPAVSGYVPGTDVQHEVSEGEWLHQIARCYGVPYASVHYANPYIYPNRIHPEQTIHVPNVGSIGPITGSPCVQRHTVQPGDTFFSLAQTFGSRPDILQRANPGPLYAGDQIWVPTVAPAGVPPTPNFDLVFIHQGDLAVWQSSDGRIARYPNAQIEIVDLATNREGNLILVRQTRDMNATTEIALIDRAAGTMTIIEAGLPAHTGGIEGMRWEQLLISPNGAWGAYVLPGTGGYNLTTFATDNPGTINVLSGIDHGGNAFFAPHLFPGIDDDHFLWLDGGGIYRFDYALSVGERPLHTLTDPDGIQGFTAEAWSPMGRYLLLQGDFLGGGASFVLDGETGTLALLPESSGFVSVPAATWLPNGTAVVLSPPNGATSVMYGAYLPQTAADGTLSLSVQTTAVLGGVPQDVRAGYVFNTPALQANGDRVVMTIQTDSSAGNGFYALPTNGSFVADKQNSIPQRFLSRQWVPDGSGLLVELQGNMGQVEDVLFVGEGDAPLLSLYDWVGMAISDFHWVTP